MPWFDRNVALLAVLGISFVILFPATFGPFQVTNGPASALRSIAYADLVMFCLSCLVVILRQSPRSAVQHSHPAIADVVTSPHPSLTLHC
jgi:hypothetical protein